MPGERQGWNGWDTFKKAGIVGDSVNFTDNEVVTDHAIGKTKDTIGKCWPMDAAVAYTLAAAGPDADLSAKDMVNQYTKMAAVMMTQKVGYGAVPDPRVESCGHDEVDAYLYAFPGIAHNEGSGLVAIKSVSMKGQLEAAGATDELIELSTFRTEEGDLDCTTLGMVALLKSPKFKPLKEYYEQEYDCKKWFIRKQSRSSREVINCEHTFGSCAWADDGEKTCAHHDRPMTTQWVLIKPSHRSEKFLTLWSRDRHVASVSSGWNHRMLQYKLGGYGYENKLDVRRVVLWDKVARSASNALWKKDPKFVIKQIKDALRRMSSRNFNVVTKRGYRSNLTYCWKEWGWLANMQAWVAQTSKKNRKEDDEVNGWKYTKISSNYSYGHEIAKFLWEPIEEQETWRIKCKVEGYSYYSSGYAIMPYDFQTKAEAAAFARLLSPMAMKCGAINKDGRKWDGDSGKDTVEEESFFTVTSHEHEMAMEPEQDPEDLYSPEEVLNAVFFSNPQAFHQAVKQLKENSHEFEEPTIITKEKVEGESA